MSGYTKLRAPIEPGGGTELERLARRCGTTAKMLGELAVRQLIVAARTKALPELPALDPTITGGLAVWLTDEDRTALDALAEGQGTTPAVLASLAVRHMLARAREGALPMLKPLQEAAPKPPASWEELHAQRNRWDAELLNDPDDLPEEAPLRPARINFRKAAYIVERLTRLAEEGIDPANPRAPLDDIDRLKTVEPESS